MRDTNAPIWGEQAATRINLTASLITRLVPPHRRGAQEEEEMEGRGGIWGRQVKVHHSCSSENRGEERGEDGK